MDEYSDGSELFNIYESVVISFTSLVNPYMHAARARSTKLEIESKKFVKSEAIPDDPPPPKTSAA